MCQLFDLLTVACVLRCSCTSLSCGKWTSQCCVLCP